MKQAFKTEVTARTYDEGFERARTGKKAYKVAEESPETVRLAVMAKRRRAVENGALYADKVAEYDEILERFDSKLATDPDMAAVNAMIEHGDLRADNREFCAVRRLGPTRFVFFGYQFA